MKRNVNKVMLSQKHVGLKSEEDNTTVQESLRMGERMIAEFENRKKDTSLLGSQLQEVWLRNEKLSKSIEERNSAFLAARDKIKTL